MKIGRQRGGSDWPNGLTVDGASAVVDNPLAKAVVMKLNHQR